MDEEELERSFVQYPNIAKLYIKELEAQLRTAIFALCACLIVIVTMSLFILHKLIA